MNANPQLQERRFEGKTRQEVISEHYPMVRAIACRIYQGLPRSVDVDDLISAGVEGLIEAVDRYDPERAVPLKTYARHRIHGAVVDALRAQDWVPRSVRRKASEIDFTRAQLKDNLGRTPNRREMASALSLSVNKFDTMKQDAVIRPLLSLDAPIGQGNATPLVDQVACESDPSEHWQSEQLRTLALEGIQSLPERERTAIALYYFNELSLKEVGKVL
ncbi:MAG: sigma-70 family RNA polymerase sigma factor, partial [Deltaproteobacteria bacterium]|nr:sigma-70 family RNA polymerase sigma factor [Deltaproteobacteria bacterium]